MDPRFEILINPPQEVFEQAVNMQSLTEDWAYQMGDYKFWSESFDKFWLLTVVEKDTREFVASHSVARWDAENDEPLYSLAFYYCVPKYRGTGVASLISKMSWEIAGDHNCHGFGEVSMVDKYAQRHGLDKIADPTHMFSSLNCSDVVVKETLSKEYSTKIWTDVDYEALTAYDLTICPRNRKEMMRHCFKLADTFTRVVLNSAGTIVGYATIRLVTKNKLSAAPFYADNLETAEVLLRDLLTDIPNWEGYANIGFFYPDTNKDLLRLLNRFARAEGLIFTCEAAKSQFTKKFIPSSDQKVYAVSDGAHQFV